MSMFEFLGLAKSESSSKKNISFYWLQLQCMYSAGQNSTLFCFGIVPSVLDPARHSVDSTFSQSLCNTSKLTAT